ncbi:DUF3551 domain-containing protein [Rhodopseudomonas pseudopalustris]|uniref:DUF3551 domain-containing protein n=2 Tax=Rhodopseudomonas TaxID=1073 RepID=Q130J0_RHOPS|nr:DUF3551 domain-containing protein [Rhodopseudomonas pseudopalustris]ABE41499.1 hypothetical protein RPD_4282 [Rhodopseudomonas palustris BisB5]SEO07797.1 Protein of unknown function [Rhodopseudomonas pseudopalustris]
MQHSLKGLIWRRSATVLAATSAVVAGFLAAGTPAEARDYPYCLTSPGYGYPGDCSYASYNQCRAAASGRLADCNVNPRVSFREPRRRDYRTYGDRW